MAVTRDYKICNFGELVGRVLANIEVVGDEEILFTAENGDVFRMYHEQDCCEGVGIESIVGDWADLLGSPILLAGERTSDDIRVRFFTESNQDSETWTFYVLATIKGYVDIRWYGSSNGYYSERVNFVVAVA